MSSFTLTNVDFQQGELDLGVLTPVEFEKLIFHLLDEMGFTDLVWRKGGEGNSATDGGRDLEAKYWRVEPVGSVSEKYRIEVKHRKSTLEKSQVQKAVLDAVAPANVDGLIIVTSGVISNPCLDWIEDFRNSHKGIKISIWQRHDLELLLLKNPRSLARFIPSALTFSGRCKVTMSRFENLYLLPGNDELVELWERREEIKDQSFLIISCIFAESQFGDIGERPWGMWLPDDELLPLAILALVNYFPLFLRAHVNDRDNASLISGVAYLIMCVGIRFGYETASAILFQPESMYEDIDAVDESVNDYRVRPVLGTIYDDLARACSSDYCRKMSYGGCRSEEKLGYFQRFIKKEDKAERDGRFLVMNMKDRDCDLGVVPRGELCPLPEDFPEDSFSYEFVKEKLKFAVSVLESRIERAETNA